MISLGIDPSVTSFGWVALDSTKTGRDMLVAKGRIETYSNKDYHEENPKGVLREDSLLAARFQYLEDQFTGLITEFKPDFVGSEAPPIGAGSYSEGLYALYMQTVRVLMRHKLNTVYVAPEQLKLLAFSAGRKERSKEGAKMFKSDMVKTALKLLGLTTGRIQNDEADAFHCAYYGMRFWQIMALREEFIAVNPLEPTERLLGYGSPEWEAKFQEFLAGRMELAQSEKEVFLDFHTYTRGEKAGTTDYNGIVYKPHFRFFRFAEMNWDEDTLGRIIRNQLKG